MNFVVYGQARTGSTLLVSLLQSHPQIQCDGEILNPGQWRRGIKRYLRKIVRHIPEAYVLWEANRAPKDTFGFKLLHMQVPVSSRLISNLHRLQWQLIHIQRRSLFDVAISRQVAWQKQHWGDYKPSLQTDGIVIPVEDFLGKLQKCVAIKQEEFHTLAELPHISVVYEEDLLHEQDRQRIFNLIFSCLRIEPHQVATTKKRSWDRPYSELVTNFAELQDLMETEHGRLLQSEWERLFRNG